MIIRAPFLPPTWFLNQPQSRGVLNLRPYLISLFVEVLLLAMMRYAGLFVEVLLLAMMRYAACLSFETPRP